MQGTELTGARRLLAVLALLFVLSTAFFAVCERFHDCSGDGCPVCRLVRLSEQALRLFGVGIAAIAVRAVPPLAVCHVPSNTACPAVRARTLVARKIRLND